MHWAIFSEMREDCGFSADAIRARRDEIAAVAARFGFASVHSLGFPATRLDAVPIADVVAAFARLVAEVRPETLYVPYDGDAHTDHAVVFSAATACAKWFRFPFVRRVLAYETLSETDAALGTKARFTPNSYVDISKSLEEKVAILKLYESELGNFPFPRSNQGIRALAAVRGVASGYAAAEAFMLLKERR